MARSYAIFAAVTVRIREAQPTDAAAMVAIYAPYVVQNAVSFEEIVPSAAEFAARIENGSRTHPWLVAELDGEIAGYAYASSHRARAAYRWCVEVSVYIGARFRRAGLGRALYRALFERLRERGFVNAYAGITLPNDASVRLHEALGFSPIGVFERIGFKQGRWHDVGWYALRLREDEQPDDPT
jgi:L-amino acid N-acyltransferase YncA